MFFQRHASRFARRVSAIIPCHNAAPFLSACLDSLLDQESGYRPGEIILIDDDSNDDSPVVIRDYRKRFRAIRSWRIKAGNANRARAFGVSMCRGDVVLMMDADNWLEPDFVRVCLNALETPDPEHGLPAFAYGDRIMHYQALWHPEYDPRGPDVARVKVGPFDIDRLRVGNYIDFCALIRKEFVDLDPALEGLQDWDLWLKIAAQNRTGRYVPSTAFHYRVHDNNQTRKRISAPDDRSFDRIVHRHGLEPWIAAARKRWPAPPRVSLILIAKTEAEIEAKKTLLQRQSYPLVEFCTSTLPGFAPAFQDAMDKATGDILVFTETDCTPLHEHWLAELVAAVEPDTVVHGLTVTDSTPNMANTALPAAVAKRFPRNPDFDSAEDTEWFLRMERAGIRYKQLNNAIVFHTRPFVRTALRDRAYRYGRDWVRLSRAYGYVTVEALRERAENEKVVAERTLQGIRDQLESERNEP
jgi:glycosyltransferase involved in cell wall biosynthesis